MAALGSTPRPKDAVLEEALDALEREIRKELGGTVRRYIASAEDPQVEILA